MTFKVVNISNPGTSTKFGADDHDKIAKYLNGINLVDPVGPIDTDTIYKSNKLIFRDINNAYNINIITSEETQSGSITIPTLDGNVTMLLDNDVRLYDTRDPNPHTISHQVGQPDVIPIDTLGEPTDTTLLNTSIDAHGLAPKLPGDGLLYMDGNGNFTAPSGTGILPDGSLINAKLADDTITADKIAPATITNTEIAVAAAIAYSKLALTNSILLADLNSSIAIPWSYISKTGSILADILDINVTGRANGDSLKWDSGTSKWIIYTPSAGGGGTPSDNSVTTIKIVDANVTTVKIADGNVTLAKLASNSVDSSKIVDGSIMNADINSSAAIAWAKVSKSGSVLADIGNTSIASPSTGQVLTWNGSVWNAQTPSSSSGADSANPVNPNVKAGWIMGGIGSTNNSAGDWYGGGLLEHTLGMKIINTGNDSTGVFSSLTTTSTSQTNAQFCSGDTDGPFRGSLNPKLYVRFKMPSAANIRMFIGFTDEVPVATNTYNSLDGNVGFGIRFDTTNDTHFIALNNNGGGTATTTDTGVTPGSGTLYDLELNVTGGGATYTMKLNGSTVATKTSNIPTSSTGMGWGAMVNTHTSAVRNLNIYYVRAVQDG